MKRRTFLAAGLGAGVLAAGFTLRQNMPAIPKRPKVGEDTAMGWISYKDDRYQMLLPRIEMGQNIATGLKQIACDELDIMWEDIDVRMQDTLAMEMVRATVGSESISDFALPLAQACASLRDAVSRGEISGAVSVTPRPVSELRAFSGKGRYVGGSVPLVQGLDIVRGNPLYAGDIRIDGMVFGRVLRSPTSPEIASRPKSWNAEAARATPGFVAIVVDDRLYQGSSQGIGIISTTPDALENIADALDVNWEVDGNFEQSDIDKAIDIDRRLAKGKLAHEIQSDEFDAEMEWDIDLRFDIPAAAHSPIEPRCAVARIDQQDTLEVWAGNQDIFYVRDHIAKVLKRSRDKISVKAQRVGGGFGGKTLCLVEHEAAILAEKTGRPVKVQWTRAQEFLFAYHRPQTSHRVRARLSNGQLDSWHHAFASSHIFFTNAAIPRWMHLATDLLVGDPGVARGSELFYRANTVRIEYDLERLPMLGGPWRGLGAGPNTLALESTIDECALRAKSDPLEFRLQHIEDPRLARVLGRVGKSAKWPGKRRLADGQTRTGRGVACGVYKSVSYTATIADVTVDADGTVKITRIWCAIDCGLVINPDQVQAQCEGNIVWSIGMVLSDQLDASRSRTEAETFGEAPIPLFTDVPPMNIELIKSDAPPSGAGEAAMVSAAAAIANAIRDATGVRPTRFPVRPDTLVQGAP
jgi:isoquinoline 1-oxidoreductase beta subunit